MLTAHPTEARRRAVATALRRIAEQLTRHSDPRVGDDERFVARRRLLEEVDLLYRTSVLRATRPGPLDEVQTIMTVFDETLFRAVPRLYRATEATLVGDASGSVPTPVPAFVRFGSWVGGDRDGNPFVTAEVTRQAVATHAEHALRWLYAGRAAGRAHDDPGRRGHPGLARADDVAGRRRGGRPRVLRRAGAPLSQRAAPAEDARHRRAGPGHPRRPRWSRPTPRPTSCSPTCGSSSAPCTRPAPTARRTASCST